MTGSQKQIKWAKEIQTKIEVEFAPKVGTHPLLDSAINTIMDIDYAGFWIDYRDYSAKTLLSSLGSDGLFIKGRDFSDNIVMDRQGNITSRNI